MRLRGFPVLNLLLQTPPDLLQGPILDLTLAPGLYGPHALSAAEEGHRRDPEVMDRYRVRAAISILVLAGLHGPPVLHLVDQVRGPGAVVMERSK